jgi:hypothetical protein
MLLISITIADYGYWWWLIVVITCDFYLCIQLLHVKALDQKALASTEMYIRYHIKLISCIMLYPIVSPWRYGNIMDYHGLSFFIDPTIGYYIDLYHVKSTMYHVLSHPVISPLCCLVVSFAGRFLFAFLMAVAWTALTGCGAPHLLLLVSSNILVALVGWYLSRIISRID